MARVSLRLSRSTVWGWVLAAGAVLIGGYFAVTSLSPWESAPDLYFDAVSLLATVGIATGIAIQRPARPLPWILLAVGQLLFTVGDVLAFVTRAMGNERFPGVPDAFYLMQFPLVISALAVLVRRRTPGWHAPTWIDSAVLGTAAALVWWVYVVAPLTSGSGLTRWALAVIVAYPVMDLLVLAVALRLMLGGGSRPASFRLLVASLAAMLAADVTYTLRPESGSWIDASWVHAAWLISYLLAAVAALHPSMRTLDTRTRTLPPTATGRRLSTLAAASLLAPTVLLVQYLRADTRYEPVIAMACMALFLLVLARMTGLVAVQRITAITDGLTRLRTRGYFTETLRTESERARRSGRPLGLVIADADHFKRVNDTHGHPAGDEVLVEIAKRLRQHCRAADTVARYGGEEFVILLPDVGTEGAAAVGERIRAGFATPITVNGDVALHITMSIGAASADGHEADPESLLRTADEALYAAKHRGRDQVVAATVHPNLRPAHTEPDLLPSTAA